MDIPREIGIYLGAIAAAVLLGLLVERVARRRLQERARLTRTAWDDWAAENLFHFGPALLLALGTAAMLIELRPPGPRAEPVLAMVLKIVLILFLVRFATDAALFLVRLYNARLAKTGVSILRNTVRVIAGVVGLLIILDQFGVSVGPILATLGVGGIALALALQPTLGNIFAGIQMVAANQFKVGDFIGIPSVGVEGTVTDIGWRTTTLQSLLDNTIVIPNSQLADAIFTNLHAPELTLRIAVGVGVHYDTDLALAERTTLDVIRTIQREAPGAVTEWEGEIRWREFGDSAITFDAILMAARPLKRFEVTNAFVKALHRRFDEVGIEIPYPIRNLYLRTGVRLEPEATESES